MLAVNASAAEQTKLVRAYEAAHPGNFTYVGVDIANVSRIYALDMKQMLEWASLLGDQICTSSAGGNVTSRSDGNVASDGRNRTFSLNSTDAASSGVDCSPDGAVASYTHQDYLKFVFASSHLNTLDAQRTNSTIPSDMAHQGYSLKTIFPGLGIFNKSMDTGGEGTYTEFVPAWAAKAIAFGGNKFYDFQPEIATMSSNLDNGPSESTDNSSTGLVPRAAGGEAPRFGALQFVADSVTKSSVVSPKPAVAAVAPLKSAGGASVDPLEQPLQDNQSLLVLSLQEGSWADGRDAWVQFAQKNTPDIADKYFGPGKSGSGPIGRHWTHLVLIMTMAVRNGSTGTVETELFGKVWKYCRG